MALGIVCKLILDNNLDIEVRSFGLAAFDGQSADKNAITAMDKIGIDIRAHKALRVIKEDFEDAQIIYVMTYSQKNIILDSIPELEDKIKVLDIPDPVNKTIEDFEICRDEIYDYFIEEIKNLKP